MDPEATAKPSNADYPVDPADRVSQQERLRKAAAAGADALKSSISLVPSRLQSPPTAMPQKPLRPLPALTQSVASAKAAPQPSQALVPEIPADRNVPRNENELILAELRKISAWADLQRKITKWSLIFLAVFIPGMVGFGMLMEQRLRTANELTSPRQKPDWYDVEHNVRFGDFDKAIGIGEELILKTPQYPEAHQRLAGAYLAAGKLDKAREHYAEAFRLFPSEENEKLLLAIDKRSNAEKP